MKKFAWITICLFSFVFLFCPAIANMNPPDGRIDTGYGNYTDNTAYLDPGVSVSTKKTSKKNALPGAMMLLVGEPEGFKLTINKVGAGTGKVRVSPSGSVFPSGTVVTLTAEANLGSSFNGWSGECTGKSLICNVTMDKDKSVTADFGIESLVPRTNQAILGPLAGAAIRVYRLTNLSSPFKGPFQANNSLNVKAAGTFDLVLKEIPDNEWILVTATGGWDIDADDNGVLDPNPTRNHGTLHALARASWWRKGGMKVSALTDIAWHYSRAWVGQTSIGMLKGRLDQIAETLLVEKISGQGEIDVLDLLKFVPNNSAHRKKLSFDYNQLLSSKGFVSLVHTGADIDILERALDLVFGAHLGFSLPENLETEVQVRLSAFGLGRVVSDDNRLLVDSEKSDAVQKPMAIYTRDREQPVIFTATPVPETQILGWEGCDWVSEDLTQCRAGLSSNRHVQVDFGYKKAIINPKFIDLSLAEVTWQADILDVLVDLQDTELLTKMATIAPGWFVAGMSHQGSFLMKVTAVSILKENRWQLSVTQASLEDVIDQGTGTLKQTMTHGDLVEDAYLLQTHEDTGEMIPVRLVPSADPNDPVFRIEIGDITDTGDPQEKASGNLIIKDGDTEIKVHGEVEVLINVETGLSYKLFRGLQYFKFIPKVDITPAITLSCSGPTKSVEKRKKIITLNFTSIKFTVGPVPVWVTPTVDVYIGVSGSVEASLNMGVSYSMTARAGVQYNRGKWENMHAFERNWLLQEPVLKGSGSIKGFLATEPSLMIYSLTGPGLGIEAALKAAITSGFDPLCSIELDWGLWAVIQASLKWKGNESIPILGKLLKQINLEFVFYQWDQKISGGQLKACAPEPPVLVVEGIDINKTVIEGSSEAIQTTYILTNTGRQTMPWSIQTPTLSPVSVNPFSGSLVRGASQQVTVSVEATEALAQGEHLYRLDFKNEYSGGPIGQNGLGSVDRYVRISVLPEAFPPPVLTSAERYTSTTAKLEWTYPDNSIRLLAGFNILYTLDPTLNSGWVKVATIDRNQRSITLQGLPEQTLYVLVEASGAYGADPAFQSAYSDPKTINKLGLPFNRLLLPDTGQTKCYDNDKEITCPQPGQPFYGQDSQYPRIPRSYTKLGYGGVVLSDNALHVDDGGPWIMTRDNVTGLIWEVKTNANRNDTYTWENALSVFIPQLNAQKFGGFSDWRLPEVKELSSLVNRGVHNPAIDTAWFPKTMWDFYWLYCYWSSTESVINSGFYAWCVNFSDGGVWNYIRQTDGHYVRAVYSGQ